MPSKGKKQHQKFSSFDNRAKTDQMFKPSRDQLLAAIESLYEDQIRPVGSILRKRVAEHSGLDSLNVDIDHAKSICEALQCIKVEEAKGDWSAVFRNRRQAFVSVDDPDNYPDMLWKLMAEFFEKPEGRDLTFPPGGRYSIALWAKKLPELRLANYSLGEVNHIIELALTKKKILGYSKSKAEPIVPYARSHTKEKVDRARDQTTTRANDSTALQIATLSDARQHLRDILTLRPALPLRDVKRLFRSKYNTELSETSLGYEHLNVLLQNELSDLCTVSQNSKDGYIVERVCRFEGEEDEAEEEEEDEEDGCRSIIKNTFIHYQIPENFTSAARRSKSLPAPAVPRHSSLSESYSAYQVKAFNICLPSSWRHCSTESKYSSPRDGTESTMSWQGEARSEPISSDESEKD